MQKLKDSELRYRRLFEAAQDGILILDALTGMIGKNQRVKDELIRSLSIQNNPLLQISLIQVLTESGVKEAKDEIESMSRSEKTDEKVKAFAKDMIKIII